MGNQDGVAGDAVFVLLHSADRPVMNLQFRQRLAGSEFEIAQDVIALGRGRVFSGGESDRPENQTSGQ